MSETDLARLLRSRGYRLTRQRLAVINIVQGRGEHLTPWQVFQRARHECPGLGLTTVYRTLELLHDLGYLRRVHLEEGCGGYAYVGEKGGHHLVCESCHRVVDFPCTGLSELIEETERGTGFTVESHLLELVGLCPDCRSARRS